MKKRLLSLFLAATIFGTMVGGSLPAAAQGLEDLLITDCTPRAGSTVQDANGTWSRAPGGVLQLQNDGVIGGGTAIAASMQYGTLRGLHYVLDSSIDISKYTYLKWDMRLWAEKSGGASSNWGDIAAKYADTIQVVLGTGDGAEEDCLSFPLNAITVTPDERNGTLFHVSVKLEDGAGSGNFNLNNFKSFHFFTLSSSGAANPNVDTSIMRLDNLTATVQAPEAPGEDEEPVEEMTWDISKEETFSQTGTQKAVWEVKNFTIDASKAPLADLALLVSIYVENLDSPGDLSGFTKNNIDGQIELTSSGRSDVDELNWSLPRQGLRAGWNYLRLPLAAASKVGSADLSKLNYFRVYNITPDGNTTRFEVKIQDVKLTTAKEKKPMPSFFADGMLFQQNKPMKLWGRAETADASISVELLKDSETLETKAAQADAKGDWSVSLSARQGGYDAYTIVVKENGQAVKTLQDVLVGELWMAAGQSNMEFMVSQSVGGSDLIAAAKDAYLRFLLEPSVPAGRESNQPVDPTWDVEGAKWGYGNVAGDVGNVSAVAYNMALELREELDVPVGIINSALGATVIETWVSRESIEKNPEIKQVLVDRGIYKTRENFNSAADKWNQMTAMYNAKIAPLGGMNIAGVIWYQGESNAKYAYGYYAEALKVMVDDWSGLFGFEKGQMPFLVSHLAPHAYIPNMPFEYTAYMAEMISQVCREADAKMAEVTIYDLPLVYRDPPVSGYHPIHPSDKAPVGKRLAAAALGLVYGGAAAAQTAPVFKSMRVEGNRILVTFDHVGEGLTLPADAGKAVHGFAVCGEDRVFVGASAKIVSKDTVEVWNAGIANPVAVTYGFSTFNMSSNLYNSGGLPAVPFRSDKNKSTYSTPNDWTTCDGAVVWVSDVASLEAGFKDTWKPAPITGGRNSTLSFDTALRTEGAASLKISYTLSSAGQAGAGPVLNHPVMVNQLANYRYLRVAAANADRREKPFTLCLKTADGKVYTAAAVLADGTAAAHVMGAGSGFTYYQFDLTKLTDKDGAAAANAADVLGRVADMQFTVEDSGDGAVYLDEIQFSTGRFAEEAVQVPGDETDTTVSTTPSTGSPTDEDVQTPSTGLPASAGIAGVLLALSGLLSVVFYKKRLA